MSSGGFDVIIGNPPYVEYRKVRTAYTVQPVYSTLPCGNLYTLVLERSYNLVHRNGWVSLIMPLSLVCTTRTEEVRELIREHPCWISCYDMRPTHFSRALPSDSRSWCLETARSTEERQQLVATDDGRPRKGAISLSPCATHLFQGAGGPHPCRR